MIIVIGVAVLVACAVVFAVNRMNAHELETLRQEADERGQSYEVTIHNELLNTYSFEPR
ncbi:hypothetical protein [Corynebacterium sp.]|uniref:hypothetical protein n=1 Tax=Corynebacterium sp. TaxID=1720 RepID=UPI0026DD995F|nr:hypothetical protein [Corynebacterium sp.]MDO5032126.1 hypothetical protein [Corynebacterium sp.]